MTNPARAERSALCDAALAAGPDAPTLCAGWDVRELLAHLVVRERRPDAGLGIVVRPLAPYGDRVRHDTGRRPFASLVEEVRDGPPRWSPLRCDAVDRFVPLPFVHMASPIYLQRRARRGPTFRETVLMHAVGRIAYHGTIDNIQASWVKIGVDGVRQLLLAGVNDLGGTLMDENISRAAGAEHGQAMTPTRFAELVEPLGRPLARRDTLYSRVHSSGSGADRGPATVPIDA